MVQPGYGNPSAHFTNKRELCVTLLDLPLFKKEPDRNMVLDHDIYKVIRCKLSNNVPDLAR